MSYKTTQRISRRRALEILLSEIPQLPNDALGDILDALADSERSHVVSKFDNFVVSDIGSEE